MRFVFLSVLALSALAATWVLTPKQPALGVALQKAEYGLVPDFELMSSSGNTMRLQDLHGPWIASFIFTRCGGQCPILLSSLRKLSKQLNGIHLVSFSVDPADTPKVLSEYARVQGLDWLFLTGEKGQVRRLCREGFRLPVADGGSTQEPILHSNRLVLVDSKARIQGYFDASDPEAIQELIRQANGLLGHF